MDTKGLILLEDVPRVEGYFDRFMDNICSNFNRVYIYYSPKLDEYVLVAQFKRGNRFKSGIDNDTWFFFIDEL
jgi:hypothetical protein